MNKQNNEIEKNAKEALGIIKLLSVVIVVLSVYLIVNKSIQPELILILLTMSPIAMLAQNQIKLNNILKDQQTLIKKEDTEQGDGE